MLWSQIKFFTEVYSLPSLILCLWWTCCHYSLSN